MRETNPQNPTLTRQQTHMYLPSISSSWEDSTSRPWLMGPSSTKATTTNLRSSKRSLMWWHLIRSELGLLHWSVRWVLFGTNGVLGFPSLSYGSMIILSLELRSRLRERVAFGHSLNPERNHFRVAAPKRFFQCATGNSRLGKFTNLWIFQFQCSFRY